MRILAVLAVLAVLAGCSRIDRGEDSAADRGPATEVRLGYFPNVTHATALIGVRNGFFTRELGQTRLTTQLFDAGPDEAGGMLGGSIDVAFIGPGPAINAYTKSDGKSVRVVAGAASGGAQLVARPGVGSLAGKTVATPQLGNTQDVALKKWLRENNVPDVRILNSDNAQTLSAFRAGDIDAAWVPEPWASRLVVEAGGRVLVNERDLWPQGRFPATVILARTRFLAEHGQTVQAMLRGAANATQWARDNESQAQTVVNDSLAEHTGKPLAGPVIERAFREIELSPEVLPDRLQQMARDAVTAGVAAKTPDLKDFVDSSTRVRSG
ncbi:NitT/TauT family transport system substrate-binding protein [Kibdelosporangium banguiense]|uniref:NitT/TauT family transport system substrate-binding protein n=1 Tax=Kibdelosporangium banguiense TaxID=1365924 RepID=A0ABS4TSD9_9PSEU|nr:ABC transporter substrate-binding protein [Kibdelosporangium banguiense]MBP2327313.1 NitT/TauT family transport system substrate-binding protein [Kibdelosporangium banguiense]